MDFDKIAREYRSALYAQARRLTRDSDRARDLVQDTFLRCLRHPPQHLSDEKILPWLFVVMRHLFVDALRSNNYRADAMKRLANRAEPKQELEERPPWQLVGLEEAHGVLDQLPKKLRVPYEMHVVDSMSYRKISEHLQIAVPTVGTRIHRARCALREMLLSRA